jgi:hypothetical protein
MYKNTNHQPQPNNHNYEPVTLPVDYNKRFLDFTGEEIHAYYKWFLSVKGERLEHLCQYLFTNPSECLKEENLKVIETLLLHSVSTFSKPNEQIKKEASKIPLNLKNIVKPDNYLFDQRTLSICYDIGIYMGELIIKSDKKIKWELEIDDKFRDFGQPIIVKKGNKFNVNPFIVAKNMAGRIYEQTYIEGQLIAAFDAWKKAFNIL